MTEGRWITIFRCKPILMVLVPYLSLEDCVLLGRSVMPFLLKAEYNSIFCWKDRIIERFTCWMEDYEGESYYDSDGEATGDKENNMKYFYDNPLIDYEHVETVLSKIMLIKNICMGGCNSELYRVFIPKEACKYLICVACFYKRFPERGLLGDKARRECISTARLHVANFDSSHATRIVKNVFKFPLDYYPRDRVTRLTAEACVEIQRGVREENTKRQRIEWMFY